MLDRYRPPSFAARTKVAAKKRQPYHSRMATPDSSRPILVVRAQVDPGVLEEFERWHRGTHLPLVLEIPGIVSAFRARPPRARPGEHLMVYELESEESVQTAFSSAEAARARADWDRWQGDLTELHVEVFAPLAPLSGQRHWD